MTLAAAGYDVTLVAPATDTYCEDNVKVIPLTKRATRIARMTLGPLSALKLAIAMRPNLIHAHDPELIPALVLAKVLMPRTKVVFDAHEDLPAQVLSKPYIPGFFKRTAFYFAYALDRTIGRFADHIVAATPSISNNFPANKTSIVQNFPLLTDYPKLVSSPSHTAVYVGALTEIRGASELFLALDRSGDEVSCVMAGPIEHSMTQPAQSCEKFDYLGNVPAEEVSSVIAMGRVGIVCFLPYQNHIDSQPNKLFEYMAAGRAIICSDFPLWRELLEQHDCAMFVNPEDIEQLQRALEYAALNPVEMEAMGERARIAFESNYVFDSEATTLIRTYGDLIGSHWRNSS